MIMILLNVNHDNSLYHIMAIINDPPPEVPSTYAGTGHVASVASPGRRVGPTWQRSRGRSTGATHGLGCRELGDQPTRYRGEDEGHRNGHT